MVQSEAALLGIHMYCMLRFILLVSLPYSFPLFHSKDIGEQLGTGFQFLLHFALQFSVDGTDQAEHVERIGLRQIVVQRITKYDLQISGPEKQHSQFCKQVEGECQLNTDGMCLRIVLSDV
jgi:hypothetical protein